MYNFTFLVLLGSFLLCNGTAQVIQVVTQILIVKMHTFYQKTVEATQGSKITMLKLRIYWPAGNAVRFLDFAIEEYCNSSSQLL